MMPSETSLNEPATQKATGRRSSFKRSPADQPSQTQEPAGYNFSSMPSFVGKDDFMNQKPRSLAYIDQFLNMFDPYIEEVQDVRADGNCGFRAVVVGLELHQNEWPTIRYDLMKELRIYHDQYVVMFGAKECDDVKKRLNFFENGLHTLSSLGYHIQKEFGKCDIGGSLFGFDFRPFEFVRSEVQHSTIGYDVISEVVSCGSLDYPIIEGKPVKQLCFELQDTIFSFVTLLLFFVVDGSVGNDGTRLDIHEGPLGNLIAGHQEDQASPSSITPSTTSMVVMLVRLYFGVQTIVQIRESLCLS
ncbi:hypothetical protein Tco_1293257 [Tanacetum coccineum]